MIEDLKRRRVVTKRRDTKVPKFRGEIPFTYGPLDHLLKNRIYCGEVHHGGKWFPGEHTAIINRKTFDRVQQALKANVKQRKAKALQSGALLLGKLHDDRGNLMSPSFSVKNGVRYRFMSVQYSCEAAREKPARLAESRPSPSKPPSPPLCEMP